MGNKIRKGLNRLFNDMDKAYDKKPPKIDWKDNYRHIVIGEWKEQFRQKDLILKVEELPDSNIKIIIDGKKLSTNAGYGFIEINLLDEIGKFNEAIFLKATTRRVSHLRRAVNRLKAVKQDAEELINNKQDVKKFLKENGFSSLELPQIKSYLKEMINTLRDNKTSESKKKKIESKLIKFITALTYTNKKPMLGKDFTADKFQKFRYKCYIKARKIYRFKNEFCKEYCQKNRACKKCNEIDALRERLNKRYNPNQVKDIMVLGSPSKYVEEMTRREFQLDRSQYYDYVHRIEELAPQDML